MYENGGTCRSHLSEEKRLITVRPEDPVATKV